MKHNFKQYVFIILIVLLISTIVFFMKKHYNVEDRVSTLNNYNKFEQKPLGWLKTQGANIDIPIVDYNKFDDLEDPRYDLGWTYYGKSNIPNRLVIISHNVLNVSNKPIINGKDHHRFEPLMAYIYYDFVKDNKYIQYTTNNKNYLYKIYGVSFQKEDDVDLENMSKEDIKYYVSKTKKQSYFKFDIDVNEKDKLITLVTCTRFFGDSNYSFVVDARMVRKKELIKNYSVTKNNNYKKIEKLLKGDDNNE